MVGTLVAPCMGFCRAGRTLGPDREMTGCTVAQFELTLPFQKVVELRVVYRNPLSKPRTPPLVGTGHIGEEP
jgi:hypothetical protein